ncbi:hypothetical protein [Azospirillum sp. A39]|uniref:hypothetical protein n=1 Tax=Azospirillum sp. A39 TaxID=3462279 RepID=UPI00404616EE
MAEGGRYVMKDGKRVRVQEPTRDHPEGHGARDADGRLIGRPPAARPAKAAKGSAPMPAPMPMPAPGKE